MCGLTGAEQIGRITSLYLLATLALMQPRTPLAFYITSARCWLMFNLVSIKTPRAFSAKLLPKLDSTQCALVPGAVPPQVQDFAFPFVEFHEVPVSPLLQPVKVSGVAAQPSGISATHRIIKVGRDLKYPQVQPSTQHYHAC